MGGLLEGWIGVQNWIFETLVSPILFHFGLMSWFEPAFDAVEFFMLGVVQIAVIALGMRLLERRWSPDHPADGRLVGVDRIYTALNKLGVIPLIVFIVAYPITTEIERQVRVLGFTPPRLEHLIPWLRDHALVTFLLYFALYDFAAYWVHRAQHRLSWWWALHSLHHSQRNVTVWSDDRNHVLDDVLASIWTGTIALLIGVAPAEFPLVLIAFRLIESLSHTNARLGLGRIGNSLIVGPQYHRLHHSIEHADPPFDRSRGCNFAVIFPIWDVIFRTRRRDDAYPATGVASLTGPAIRAGYLRHQLEGFRRLGAELGRLAGRRSGFAAAFPQE